MHLRVRLHELRLPRERDGQLPRLESVSGGASQGEGLPRARDRGLVRPPTGQSVIVTVRMPLELAEWLRDDMGKRSASEREPGWVYQRVVVALIGARETRETRS